MASVAASRRATPQEYMPTRPVTPRLPLRTQTGKTRCHAANGRWPVSPCWSLRASSVHTMPEGTRCQVRGGDDWLGAGDTVSLLRCRCRDTRQRAQPLSCTPSNRSLSKKKWRAKFLVSTMWAGRLTRPSPCAARCPVRSPLLPTHLLSAASIGWRRDDAIRPPAKA